jgi:hypothetical protein
VLFKSNRLKGEKRDRELIMRYRLNISGQVTVQRAQKIVSSLRPAIFSEVSRTSGAAGGGCSWSLLVDAETPALLEYVLNVLQYHGISPQSVTTESGASWRG